jgi:hypothetical protein
MSRSTEIALLAAALAAAAVWLAKLRQQRSLASILSTVELSAKKAGKPGGEAGEQEQSIDSLPPPVSRYLKHALSAEKRRIVLARYRQVGTLRTDARSERWFNFTASQITSPSLSEFVWDARIYLVPLLHLRVVDSLVGGRGAGQVTLMSAVPIGSAGGTAEMNSSSLHRFLAESVWCPTALLPSPALRWTPIDDARALATLTRGDVSVSLEFRFNRRNEVESIYTPGRWGSFDGGFKRVAWEGVFRDYARRDGVLVPTQGEVGWYADGEWRSVWRGLVVSLELEFE